MASVNMPSTIMLDDAKYYYASFVMPIVILPSVVMLGFYAKCCYVK